MAISPITTTAVSPLPDSKGKDIASSSCSQSKQHKRNTAWEIKRKLVKKRLMDLANNSKINQEESANTERPIICYPPKESPTGDLHGSVVVSTSTVERAEEVQANLSPQFPSFLKHMLKSHVSGGFWLGLPRGFCIAHLPDHDETVVLVDENGKEWDTKYLAPKNGLSGGWRGFSIAHDLRDGDVLVFQLIEPCKFKIYIVRAGRLTEIDGATSLLTLNFHSEPTKKVKIEDHSEESARTTETRTHTSLELVVVDNQEKKDMATLVSISEVAADQSGEDSDNFVPVDNQEKKDTGTLVSISEAAGDQSGDDSHNLCSEIMDGIRFSESLLSFKDVKGFENFNVHVDGLIIDSEIPLHLRTKYYELCCSQNMFLHENFICNINSKLAAGMIIETINIADAIRIAKLSTDPKDLESWDKTLSGFEVLGMVVGFLRARIHKLLNLSRESQAMIELKRTKRAEALEEIRALKKKLSEVKLRVESLDAEIDGLKAKNVELDAMFREVGGAPW